MNYKYRGEEKPGKMSGKILSEAERQQRTRKQKRDGKWYNLTQYKNGTKLAISLLFVAIATTLIIMDFQVFN